MMGGGGKGSVVGSQSRRLMAKEAASPRIILPIGQRGCTAEAL